MYKKVHADKIFNSKYFLRKKTYAYTVHWTFEKKKQNKTKAWHNKGNKTKFAY